MQNIMKLERVIGNSTCINIHKMNETTIYIDNHLNSTETARLYFDRNTKMSLNVGKKGR